MDKPAAFRLLRVLLGGKFLRSGVEVHERTSRWLWALLARLPDRGELDHVEVGHVRELGKRAAVLMHSLRQMALLREEVELGGHDDEAGEGVWGEDEDEEDDENEKAEIAVEQKEAILTEETTNISTDNKSPTQHFPTSTSQHGIPASYGNNNKPANSTINSHVEAKAETTKGKLEEEDDDEMEDGEIGPDESIPMDMDMEEEEEETEATEATTATTSTRAEDMETAKARLLASLDAAPSESDDDEQGRRQAATITPPPSSSKSNGKGQKQKEKEDKEEDQQRSRFDAVRARMNMRATLNMILTVAGEFYGQRDLLEFRDPFHGI